jgi:hypothetical protein
MHVGPEAVREHIGIEAVILGLGDREAVTETIELFGVDGIDIEAALEQGLHDRAMWGLYGDMDLAGRAPVCFEKPSDHIAEAGAAMDELALSNLIALGIAECDDMLLRCPVNTDKPTSFFVHRVVPLMGAMPRRLLIVHANTRATATPSGPCTGARRRGLPTGRGSRPFHRGTSPMQALTKSLGRRYFPVAPGESARS